MLSYFGFGIHFGAPINMHLLYIFTQRIHHSRQCKMINLHNPTSSKMSMLIRFSWRVNHWRSQMSRNRLIQFNSSCGTVPLNAPPPLFFSVKKTIKGHGSVANRPFAHSPFNYKIIHFNTFVRARSRIGFIAIFLVLCNNINLEWNKTHICFKCLFRRVTI